MVNVSFIKTRIIVLTFKLLQTEPIIKFNKLKYLYDHKMNNNYLFTGMHRSFQHVCLEHDLNNRYTYYMC